MGKGGPLAFLNKKTWHPGRVQNKEEVWKREQEKSKEEQKLKDLQKQIAEERAREEMHAVAEAAGVKLRSDRLDWMYQGGMQARQEADQRQGATTAAPEPAAAGPEAGAATAEAGGRASALAALPSFYSEDTPASANEMWQRLHADPLFAIKQQEVAARRSIAANPVQMQAIKQQVRELQVLATGGGGGSQGEGKERHKKEKKEKREKKERHKEEKKEKREKKEGKERHKEERRKRRREAGSGADEQRPAIRGGVDEDAGAWRLGGAMELASRAGEVREEERRDAARRGRNGGRGEDERGEHRDGGHRRREEERGERRDMGQRRGEVERGDEHRRSGRGRAATEGRKHDGGGDGARLEPLRRGGRSLSRSPRPDRRPDTRGPSSRRSASPQLQQAERAPAAPAAPRLHADADAAQGAGAQYGISFAAHVPREVQHSDRSAAAEATRRRLEEAAALRDIEDRLQAAQRHQRRDYRPGQLGEEERQARLREMARAADEHDAQRARRLQGHAELEAAEEEEQRGRHHSETAAFLRAATQDVYGAQGGGANGGESLADTVGRRKAFSQRADGGAAFRK